MTIILIQACAEQHHRAECVALCDDLVVLRAGIRALMQPVILRATCNVVYCCACSHLMIIIEVGPFTK